MRWGGKPSPRPAPVRRGSLRQSLLAVGGGSKGGPTRLRILIEIKRNPMNPNQISKLLGLGYKTVMYHLNILEKSGLIKRLGNKYGSPYYTTEVVDANWAKIIKLAGKLGIDAGWD